MSMIHSQMPMNQGCFPPMGGGGQMGGGGMMQMMRMMMQMMQMLMSLMMGGGPMGGGGQMGGFSPGMNPNFGGGGPMGGGCGCGGGGAPFNNFLGGGGNRMGGGNNYMPQNMGPSGPLPTIQGSGQGADATRWALGMEGISESRNPGTVRAISRGKWQHWCADFVSQAYANSGGSPFGHQSSVAGILNWGQQNGRFFSAGAASQNPRALVAGDIAVWKSNGRSHVGLVTGVNPNGTFNTIEGNSGNAVRRRTHSLGGRGLTGFVRPRGPLR